MTGTSQPSPKRGPRPKKPQRWPVQAGRVADEIMAALIVIQGRAESIDRQSERIDRWADLGAEALRLGNYFVAEQMLLNIRNATATQRHTAADLRTTAGDARAALAAARRGEYGGEG